jgi:hypothetical protein
VKGVRARRRELGVLAVTAVAAFLSACSVDKQVDTHRAEEEIKRSLASQTGDQVRSVRCPDEVKAEKGRRFRCRAVASDGSRIPVVVTQTDDDGGVRWRVAGGG